MTGDVVAAASGSWNTSFVGEFDVGRGESTALFSLPTATEGESDLRAAVARRLDAVQPAVDER